MERVGLVARSFPGLATCFTAWFAACDAYWRRSADDVPSEDLPGDDPLLDLVGALVDLADIAVPVDRLDVAGGAVGVQLAREAEAAEGLDGVACHVHGQLGGVVLRHRVLGLRG